MILHIESSSVLEHPTNTILLIIIFVVVFDVYGLKK